MNRVKLPLSNVRFQTQAERKAKRLRDIQAQHAASCLSAGLDPDALRLAQHGGVTLDIEGWQEHDEKDPNHGLFIKARRGRRTNNPFLTLYTAGTISKAQQVAGDYLVTVYAQSRSLDGAPEQSPERVQSGPIDPHMAHLIAADAGRRFADIISRIEKKRYQKLLRELVRDIVLGDGSGNLADGSVRWRSVVASAIGLTSDKQQSMAVKLAVLGLPEIIDAHIQTEERRRKELRKAA